MITNPASKIFKTFLGRTLSSCPASESVLVLNCGSSSLKFKVVNPVTEDCVMAGQADRLLRERRGVMKYQVLDEKFSEVLEEEDTSYQVRPRSSALLYRLL